MEKKSYLKPEIYKNEFESSASFLATFGIIYEEDSEVFQGLLDDCLQIRGEITNDQLKTYLLSQTDHTACFKGWAENESGNISCSDGRFSDNVGVTIKYDETNAKFILTFSGCTDWVTDITGSSSGGRH